MELSDRPFKIHPSFCMESIFSNARRLKSLMNAKNAKKD